MLGFHFGDPRFIIYDVLLELSYILLAFFVAKGYRKTLYACIFLAIIIIVGNSFVTAHIYRMMTLSRPLNTVVLILGGYILQFLLIYTSIRTISFSKRSNFN